LRTNCSAAASNSSVVTVSPALRRTLMLRHIVPSNLASSVAAQTDAFVRRGEPPCNP
jgi:hypothetical protein